MTRDELNIRILDGAGLTVTDSGGKRRPFYIRGLGNLTSDDLNVAANVILVLAVDKAAGELGFADRRAQ